MRTDVARAAATVAALLLCLATLGAACAAEPEGGAAVGKGAGEEQAPKFGSDWQSWKANNDVADLPSAQRGARNFVSYCLGCHSLKYERWSRLGADLQIPLQLLEKDLVPPGDKANEYILTSMPAGDAASWFGKTPPDLSLMARARGRDYLYQFLKTFYVDPSRQTGANNLRLPTTAMPHVLSSSRGSSARCSATRPAGCRRPGDARAGIHHFEQVAGRLRRRSTTAVRGTVNFMICQRADADRPPRSGSGWCCSCWCSPGSPGW
jgi:ubiquinol-cytochrome c reductase cytochrome c1 subunit